MKKIFLTLAVFVMALCASAQKNQYFWYQGNLMMGNPIAQIDSVTFGEGEPTDTLHIMLPRTIIKTVHDTVYVTVHDTIKPNTEGDKTTYNGHEYVDLGLPSGTLWATCNVDAASPDQLGGYYGWGCLTPYPGTYCGNIPVSNISGTEYDVARVKWGGEWRMPTNEECLELAANCSRKDTTINGKSGIVVRGTNNNYIFIPGSGYCGEDAYVQDAGGPGFWTSTGGPTYPYRVWEWIYNSISPAAQGWQIRPVVSKTDDVISQTETISGAQIVHDTVYITIHDTVCPNEKIEGVLPGEFSVSATKKVRFSKGNLQ